MRVGLKFKIYRKSYDTLAFMKRYWTLLSQEPLLRKLSLIQLIAYFGAWFSNVAIYTLLISMEVEPSIIALVAALHFFAGVLQAPLSGVIIDRIHPKKLMIVLAMIEILSTLSLITVEDESMLMVLYILVFIRMGAASFQFTVEMSLLPRVLEGKALQIANEIHSIIWSLSYTVGMALGGFVVYVIGVRAAFLLDAALFTIALYLITTLHIEVIINDMKERFSAMMGDALRYINTHRVVFHLMVLHALIGFTAFDALVALSAQYYYSQLIAVSLGIGLLHAFRALGLVIGPVVLGSRMNNNRLGVLFIVEAITIGIWAVVIEHFYLSLAASILVGFVTTTLWSYTYTLLQHHTNEAYYGRVIAYNDMLFLSVGGVASLLIGALVEWGVSLAGVAVVLASAFALGAYYYHWIRRSYSLKEISDEY